MSGHVLMLMAVVAGAAVFEIRTHQQGVSGLPDSGLYLLQWILPFAWLFVIAGVVHQEALPGTRQYWITRPIPRWALLVEKIAFVALWVNFLWFLSDCVILAALGLPIHPSALVLRQIPMTVIFFLPAFCLASVTKGLGQVALGLIGCAVAVILVLILPSVMVHQEGNSVSFLYLRPNLLKNFQVLLPALCLLLLALQFLRTATTVSRILLGLCLLLTPYVLLVATGEFPQPGETAERRIRVNVVFDFDLGRHPQPTSADGYSVLQLPVRLEGLPAHSYLEGFGMGFLSPTYAGSVQTPINAILYTNEAGEWLRISSKQMRETRANLEASLNLSLFHVDREKAVRLDQTRPFSTAPGQVCWPLKELATFRCWQGPSETTPTILRAYVDLDGDRVELGNSHNESVKAPWTFSPLIDWNFAPMRTYRRAFDTHSTVQFINLSRAGTAESSVSAQNVDLLAYVVK